MFDWQSFLHDYDIEYVTRGPNVKRGNINIACPMCGDDPTHHMGIALDSENWGCWRDTDHRGKKPNRLVRELLGCSYNQANIIVNQYSASDPEDLDDALVSLMADEQPVKKRKATTALTFPDTFKPIKNRGLSSRYWNYLYDRGFHNVEKFLKRYKLMCCDTGTYKNRIIIPIYRDKELVSWTTRAIGHVTNAPRYLALSEKDGGLVNVFHTLYNWDRLMKGGELMIVAEGPFDALKLDFYGYREGVCATCTFGTSMSEEQAYQIAEASKKFNKAILLYDAEATSAIFHAKGLLEHTKIECSFLPKNTEDPGEMTKKQVLRFIHKHL